ncbi:MAG TPA: hypothetical protein VJA40_02360 [archaeon]|nr:hypothetical protein [archaeon]
MASQKRRVIQRTFSFHIPQFSIERRAPAQAAKRQQKGLQAPEHRLGLPLGEGKAFVVERSRDPEMVLKRLKSRGKETGFPESAQVARQHAKKHAFLEKNVPVPGRRFTFVDLSGAPVHAVERITPLVHTFNTQNLREYKVKARVERAFLELKKQELELETAELLQRIVELEKITHAPRENAPKGYVQAVLELNGALKKGLKRRAPRSEGTGHALVARRNLLNMETDELEKISRQIEALEHQLAVRRENTPESKPKSFFGFVEAKAREVREQLLRVIQKKEHAREEAREEAREQFQQARKTRAHLFIPHWSPLIIGEKVPELVGIFRKALENRVALDGHIGNWGLNDSGSVVYIDTFEKKAAPVNARTAAGNFDKNRKAVTEMLKRVYGRDGAALARLFEAEVKRQGLEELAGKMAREHTQSR